MNTYTDTKVKIYNIPDHKGLWPTLGSTSAAGMDCYADLARIKTLRTNSGMFLCPQEPLHMNRGTIPIDGKAKETFKLTDGEVAKVPLGFKIQIPVGYVGLLIPRSSSGIKTSLGLANTIGVIDSDYRGEVCALVEKRCDDYNFNELVDGVSFCQLVIVPCLVINCDNFTSVSSEEDLTETDRGAGGFGSTDAKMVEIDTSNMDKKTLDSCINFNKIKALKGLEFISYLRTNKLYNMTTIASMPDTQVEKLWKEFQKKNN